MVSQDIITGNIWADLASSFWFGMLTFAMALTIPECDFDVCVRIARPNYKAISLVNDIYSWPKERTDAEKSGQDYVFNAIWVIMQENGCDEKEAAEICKQGVRRYIDEFNIKLHEMQTKLSRDTLRYLEALRLSHVGNLVWSIYCPRYHGKI